VIKAEFSASSLQSSESHDPSKITLICSTSKSMLKTVALLYIFVETVSIVKIIG